MLQKQFKFAIKSLAEDGTFAGYASVFGVVDGENEVIDKGAFKRTLDHSKGVVPILWQHQTTEPCGWNESAEEDGHGLKVSGRLLINCDRGKQAYDFLKMGLDVGATPGLSVGFMVTKDGTYIKDGRRHYSQVVLKEYSVVTYPANDQAFVTTAKHANTVGPSILERVQTTAEERQKDFTEELTEQRVMSALWQERSDIECALRAACCDAMQSDTMTPDEMKAEISASYTQYAAAMADWYSRFIDADQDDDPEEDLDEMDKSEKAGRKISTATASQIKAAMSALAEGTACHTKAIGILEDLSRRAYTANDVNRPNPVGGGGKGADNAGMINIDMRGIDPADENAVKAAIIKALGHNNSVVVPQTEGDPQMHSLVNALNSVASFLKTA